MKILKYILLLVLSGQMLNAQTKTEKREKEYMATKSLVNSGNFIFEARSAQPLAGSSISLVTNDNYLKINNSKVNAYLPYFGEGRVSAEYPGGGPIIFQGELENYELSFNDKKRMITIKFNAMGKSERHDVTLVINRNKFTDLIIRSTNRTRISYYGKIKANALSPVE